MIGIIGGILAGLLHRLIVSPFVGRQTPKAQSVGTPAAGVMIAFIPFRLSFWMLLRRIIPDKKMRHDIGMAADYSYWTVFLFYGMVVVVTILAGIGGKKNGRKQSK